MQPVGVVEDGSKKNLEDQIYIFRLCPAFAQQLYYDCREDAELLGVGNYYSYVGFVEGIDGSVLTASSENVTAVFYNGIFLVEQFYCYEGVSTAVIEADVGTCLYPYGYVPYVEPETSNAISLFSYSLSTIFVVFLCSCLLFIQTFM
jgi:hypothetical protein